MLGSGARRLSTAIDQYAAPQSHGQLEKPRFKPNQTKFPFGNLVHPPLTPTPHRAEIWPRCSAPARAACPRPSTSTPHHSRTANLQVGPDFLERFRRLQRRASGLSPTWPTSPAVNTFG